jgi:hypothetical protein
MVEARGAWPPQWPLGTWISGAEGLDSTTTLFLGEDEQGIRLPPGKSVERGASYIAVIASPSAQTTGQRQMLPIPEALQPIALGTNRDWEAWQISVPLVVDQSTRRWCERIGVSVAEPVWRVELVSPPPHGFWMNGLPVVAPETDLIIVLLPPQGSERSERLDIILEREGTAIAHASLDPSIAPDTTATYLRAKVGEEGIYRLRSTSGGFASVYFQAIQSSTEPIEELGSRPAPLRVTVSNAMQRWEVDALLDGIGPYEVTMGQHLEDFGIEAVSLVPLDVSWWFKARRERRQRILPSDLLESLAPDLAEVAASDQRLQLHVDAGTFGQLKFHILPLQGQRQRNAGRDLATADQQTASRLRWLATMADTFARSDPSRVVPMPEYAQASRIHCNANPTLQADRARLRLVPQPLVPQLSLIARTNREPRPIDELESEVTDA